jgi:nucleoside-diphosphate-sugar epimerase
MPKAVIVGGAGQIGMGTARRLVAEGWDVTITSRHPAEVPAGCGHQIADGQDIDSLSAIAGSDCDLLMSCVAYDDTDAICLAKAGRDAGRIVSISSASVYVDDQGRTLDEAGQRGFPAFAIPLTEDNPTVAAGTASYSPRKIAMEQALFDNAACPVTILRPCAIHGPETRNAREWWFVKRLLDGRETIPLAYRGESRFQTTSVAAIADATVRAHGGALPAIVNVADADSPTVIEIGQAIMAIMGRRAELIALPETESYPPPFGASPWSVPGPIICSSASPSPVPYAEAVVPTIEWLVEHITNDNWRDRLPVLAGYPWDLFDYEAEDRGLQSLGVG